MVHTTTVPAEQGLARIIADIGEDATLLLVERFGGTRIWVAPDPTARDPIARVIGHDAAVALGSGPLGGERIKVPLAKRWRVRLLHARGLSNSAIVRQVQIDRTTVQRIVNGGRDTKQLHLQFE